MSQGDPIGTAILDYAQSKLNADILVDSDICDTDTIPVPHLFRTFDEMPVLEQVALARCSGKILDIGAAAGAHAKILRDKNFDITLIDTSPGAIKYLNSNGFNALQHDLFQPAFDTFNTVLLLMNGIGLAGRLSNLEATLLHLKTYLEPGGKILCDSTDIKYLYEDEEGGFWTDLNTEYYGNFKFQMHYKQEIGPWFDWLYVDFANLEKAANKVGLKATLIDQDESAYLAELTQQ